MGGVKSRINPSLEVKHITVPDLKKFAMCTMPEEYGPLVAAEFCGRTGSGSELENLPTLDDRASIAQRLELGISVEIETERREAKFPSTGMITCDPERAGSSATSS